MSLYQDGPIVQAYFKVQHWLSASVSYAIFPETARIWPISCLLTASLAKSSFRFPLLWPSTSPSWSRRVLRHRSTLPAGRTSSSHVPNTKTNSRTKTARDMLASLCINPWIATRQPTSLRTSFPRRLCTITVVFLAQSCKDKKWISSELLWKTARSLVKNLNFSPWTSGYLIVPPSIN